MNGKLLLKSTLTSVVTLRRQRHWEKKKVKENTFYIYFFSFFVKFVLMSGNSLVHNPLTGTSLAVRAQPP